MKISRKQIRKVISLLIESSDSHRCLDGRIVPKDSEDCYLDICARIEDAEYVRNGMSGGTATRAYYNGILADLRKKRRRLSKNLNESLSQRKKLQKWMSQPHWDTLTRGARIEKKRDADYKLLFKDKRDTSYGEPIMWRSDMGLEDPPENYTPTLSKEKRDTYRRSSWAQSKIYDWWQNNADIEFLKDVHKIHWIGWINEKAAIGGSEKPKGVNGLKFFNRKYRRGKFHKDALSTVGYTGRIPATMNAVGIVIKNSHPIFASNDDIWTNELYMATEADIEHYRSSGLPKKPSTAIDPMSVVFDSSDVAGRIISEVVIDNWSWEEIYLGASLSKKDVSKIKNYCRSANINIINNNFKGL